jgi:hypothetical protein
VEVVAIALHDQLLDDAPLRVLVPRDPWGVLDLVDDAGDVRQQEVHAVLRDRHLWGDDEVVLEVAVVKVDGAALTGEQHPVAEALAAHQPQRHEHRPLWGRVGVGALHPPFEVPVGYLGDLGGEHAAVERQPPTVLVGSPVVVGVDAVMRKGREPLIKTEVILVQVAVEAPLELLSPAHDPADATARPAIPPMHFLRARETPLCSRGRIRPFRAPT